MEAAAAAAAAEGKSSETVVYRFTLGFVTHTAQRSATQRNDAAAAADDDDADALIVQSRA